MKGIIILLIVIISTSSQNIESFEEATNLLNANIDLEISELFELFIKVYKKTYTSKSAEGELRFKIFNQTCDRIKKFNQKTDKTFELGINKFSDLSENEIKSKYLDFSIAEKIAKFKQSYSSDLEYFLKNDDKINYIPIDWRIKNLFNDARDQGDCGACWAFAVTGAMEAHFSLKQKNKNEFLSVQQLVDCDPTDKGCKGGWPSIAFNYIVKNGLVSEKAYPYTAKTSTCKSDVISREKKYKISKFDSCEEDECNKNNFYFNLLNKGPFAVVIDAYNTEFFNYKSGIYNQSCAEPNHAIILVGYGIDKQSGEDYWIIRNSWTNTWGMNGYGYVKNDLDNYFSCNINRYAFQPVVIINDN